MKKSCYILLLFLTIGCQREQYVQQSYINQADYRHDSFVLTFKSSNRFDFAFGSCTWSAVVKGKYKIENDTLRLRFTSFYHIRNKKLTRYKPDKKMLRFFHWHDEFVKEDTVLYATKRLWTFIPYHLPE